LPAPGNHAIAYAFPQLFFFMTHIQAAYLHHQLKRLMRHDAHRFLRPDWRRFMCFGQEDQLSIKSTTASIANTVPTSRECQEAIQMAGSGPVMGASEVDAKIRAFFQMLPLMASVQAPNTRRAGRVALLAESLSMVSKSSPLRRSNVVERS
jgi:hypothetical protein